MALPFVCVNVHEVLFSLGPAKDVCHLCCPGPLFSPGYFVLVVYLTLGQQNIFPTKILQKREEKPLLKRQTCRGSGCTRFGLSLGRAAGLAMQSWWQSGLPSCLQALQEVGEPLKKGVSHLLLFILFAAGNAENLINCMKPKET